MSEHMRVLPFDDLLKWILQEYQSKRSIFGIHESLFYRPTPEEPFASTLFGQPLATPIGPAAGPHTQLTQNILAAWLTGGRFIELKTVQIMDDLEIPRPCIDLADEGYNVEWSQELRLKESVHEYVKAWVLIRVLRRLLHHDEETAFGTIFNMSVGYNLEGILSEPMQAFMSTLEDAAYQLAPIRQALAAYPQFADLDIPDQITNSVTLSTMHGCPPDEIERIARYMIDERGLHTTVKLNPTLLGKETVLGTLRDTLGFNEIDIPDRVFEADLAYDRALELIRALQASAAEKGVAFGVKLSNTLAMSNHRKLLPGDEMYMSGRALFPLTVQLFKSLQSDIGEGLSVSYSAGADALNLTDLLAAGALPITVASDLLKPGGYGRFSQYLESLRTAMVAQGVPSLDALASDRVTALDQLVQDGLTNHRYKKAYHPDDLPKVSSELARFDCIEAPCMAQCAVCQDVPDYAHWIGAGETDRAVEAILHRNPLPASTGHVCTNLCQTRCTRINYDQPVAIRRLKRYALEHGSAPLTPAPASDHRVAVVGSGPSGLAAAFYLALSGAQVTIFEAKDRPGGMLAIAPHFRLPASAVNRDVARIEALGVNIVCNHAVTAPPEDLLDQGYSAVYIGCGFIHDASLDIDGANADGAMGALSFLDRVAHDVPTPLGEHVVVIGGGNTAMDAARTAQRLTGRPSTVVYRRTQAEMPAEEEEIHDLLLEGNRIEELAIPERVQQEGGRVTGLVCVRARLGAPDTDGRRRPVRLPGSEFLIPATTVIFAVGQRSDTGFLSQSSLMARSSDGGIEIQKTGRTDMERVYAGGDIARGPAIIIAACADGRRAAEAICEQVGLDFRAPVLPEFQLHDLDFGTLKRSRVAKRAQVQPTFLDAMKRQGFDLVEQTFDHDQAGAEARRCLQCQLLCDKCVDVCPNRANVSIDCTPISVELPTYELTSDGLEERGKESIHIQQSRQILHIDDLCNECGNCATFCVHNGRPFRDKPRLFLNEAGFAAESDNAYWASADGIATRMNGETLRLTKRSDGGWTFDQPGASLRLSEDFDVLQSDIQAPTGTSLSLRAAVEMSLLYHAVLSNASYLPLALQ